MKSSLRFGITKILISILLQHTNFTGFSLEYPLRSSQTVRSSYYSYER